ncbi:MAG: hypothetical protein ABW092_19995 [Candidatus Thiodiazotropha sp.]
MFNYYTFEGPIIHLDDSSGILAKVGLSTNDKIQYTFLINRELEGTRIKGDGSTFTYDNDRLRVYFFTNLISGSKVQTLSRFKPQQSDSVVTYNRGFESERRFDLLSGSNRHYVNVWGTSITDWPNGPTLHGLECVYGKDRKKSVISSKLSLKSISDLYSLPVENNKLPNINASDIRQYFQS